MTATPHGSVSSPMAIPSERWRAAAKRHPSREPAKNLDALWEQAGAAILTRLPRTRRYLRQAEQVLTLEPALRALTDVALSEELARWRVVFRRGRDDVHATRHAFAAVREAARRKLGLNAYREQVAAGLAVLDGRLVELATGEGKTLAATLPATVVAWRGRGCHVITVNDYLAARDAQTLTPLFSFCGVSVGCVTGQTTTEKRQQAYACDVTYGTQKEIAADLLRDQLNQSPGGNATRLTSTLLNDLARTRHATAVMPSTSSGVLRGLEHAIVDEADSVLIDEAVTPLILSGHGDNAEREAGFRMAADVAPTLEQGRDYRTLPKYRDIELTPRGKHAIDRAFAGQSGALSVARWRHELVHQALLAVCFYLRGHQYEIAEGKVVIIDEATGRAMPDRSWRAGLHQAVEAKEQLELTPLNETLGRISFQRFFTLYTNLSGMTGTAWEARHELWRTYRLTTVRIPTHRPSQRRSQGNRVLEHETAKWDAVAADVQREHQQGRPVLVGTRSVAASVAVSEALDRLGIAHDVLNAVHHDREAGIVEQAGQPGRVTVATNMAGRGTDIKLDPRSRAAGGLHVVLTELHEDTRIDRQLAGRAGRQGDPGSTVTFIARTDELITKHARRLARWTPLGRTAVPHRLAQARARRLARSQRRQLLLNDYELDQQLGFNPEGY